MEILKDKALVLKKKDVNDNNMSVLLFTENLGKISTIAYRVRNSSKKEKISLNSLSYINVEIKKMNDNYVINSYNLEKFFGGIYKNIDKLDIAFYILESLSKILSYALCEKSIYDRVYKALYYLETLDDKLVKEKDFKYRFLVSFLKKITFDLGIYDEKLVLGNDYKENLIKYEKYLNDYFNININYNKNMLGV